MFTHSLFYIKAVHISGTLSFTQTLFFRRNIATECLDFANNKTSIVILASLYKFEKSQIKRLPWHTLSQGDITSCDFAHFYLLRHIAQLKLTRESWSNPFEEIDIITWLDVIGCQAFDGAGSSSRPSCDIIFTAALRWFHSMQPVGQSQNNKEY